MSNRPGGGLRVTVNDRRYTFTAEEAQDLTIETRGGNDLVLVDDDVSYRIRLYGGDGQDILIGGAGNDKLFGGRGKDILIGGGGNDLLEGHEGDDVLVGQDGQDVLYGLDGQDTLVGGDGDDYLDGGAGNDQLFAGNDHDTLVGGRGQDSLWGGDGTDTLAGGAGQDTLDGGAGADQIIHERGETVRRDQEDRLRRFKVDDKLGSSLSINERGRMYERHVADPHQPVPDWLVRMDFGAVRRLTDDELTDRARQSERFSQRVTSDLDALRSFPEGARLLRRIDNAPGHVSVNQELDEVRGTSTDTNLFTDIQLDYEPNRTDRLDGKEQLLRSRGISSSALKLHGATHRPPVIVLAHDLIHALHAKEGNELAWPTSEADSEELRTVGLRYDHDRDRSTPPLATRDLSENSIRADMGLPKRRRYHLDQKDGDGLVPTKPEHFHD